MEIPNYDPDQIPMSPSSINEPCGYKHLFNRILKREPSPDADFGDRDAGTFCHQIFEDFLKSPRLLHILDEIATLTSARFKAVKQGIMTEFLKIIEPIIDKNKEIMVALRQGRLSFSLPDQQIKVRNFLIQEMTRLEELIDLVGAEKAALDYFLPINAETKFRTSGRLYIDSQGKRHSEFFHGDKIKFSCIVDFIRVIPGGLVGVSNKHDFYVIGDYKTGKNRSGYDRSGRLSYDIDEYAHKAVLQCVYPLIIAGSLHRLHQLRQILKCKYYEVYNPTPGPPTYESGPRKGIQKTPKNWRLGLDKSWPYGTRVGPKLITKRLVGEAKTEMIIHRRMWREGIFVPKADKWWCPRYCTDHYDECNQYWL
jgi:hypothetical protein